MKQPTTGGASYPIAPYQHILDYTKGMKLPDKITVLYCRLSNDDYQRNKGRNKSDDSDSIANQKKLLARFAAENRLQNPIFFTEACDIIEPTQKSL